LGKVLRLRSWAENDAKNELGRSVSRLSQIENDLQNLAHKQYSSAAVQFSTGEGGHLQAADLQAHSAYLQFLAAEKERLVADAALAEVEVEKNRDAWIEAKAEAKVMENLKDRRFKEYKKEQNAEPL
jgi:flagellar FliJ protein